MNSLRPRDIAALAIVALLLLGAATSGADFMRYEDWGLAGLSGDLSEARVYTISPLGVPLMMWSHGTGFVFAAADALLLRTVAFRTSAAVIGWLGALVLWAAMLRVFWITSRGDRLLTLFGASTFFLAAHGGYFSHVHASESLALSCVAVLVWLVFEDREDHLLPAFVAGLAVAFLVVIKSHLALYGAGTLLVLGMRAWRDPGSSPSPADPAARGLPMRRLVALSAVAALPVIVAVIQVGLANRWMNGSVFTSSYQFGDESFRSFDFAQPEIAAVLVNPWHGLLSYHPFYALGFVALIVMTLRAPHREQRLFFFFGAVAIGANLYIQAAWVVWWLGKGSLGMRGAASASAIVVPAFVMLLARLSQRRSPWASVLTVATIACSLWSGLLLVRGTEPQYHTYTQMAVGAADALAVVATMPFAISTVIFVVVFAALSLDDLRRTTASARALWATCLALMSFACAYLMTQGIEVWRDRPSATLLVGAGLALVAAVARWTVVRRTAPVALAAGAATVVFLLGSALFFRLAANVESDIAAGRRPERRYAYVNTFSTRDMRESCNEYRRAWGFDDKRDAFKAFLIRAGVDPLDFRF